ELTMRSFIFALMAATAPLAVAAQEVSQFADTSRLVTIGGSLTEIVYELGAAGSLVARDSTSTFPAEAASLPDVGYMRALSPEGVLSVEPSAILMLEGAGPITTLDVLESASVPLIRVPETHDAAGVATKVEVVGAALGLVDEAAALNARIAEQFAEVEALTSSFPEKLK